MGIVLGKLSSGVGYGGLPYRLLHNWLHRARPASREISIGLGKLTSGRASPHSSCVRLCDTNCVQGVAIQVVCKICSTNSVQAFAIQIVFKPLRHKLLQELLSQWNACGSGHQPWVGHTLPTV